MITNTRYFKTFGWRQDSTLSLGGNSYEFAFSSVIENADYEVSPAHDDEGHSSNRYGLELIDRKVFTMSKQPTLFRLYPGAPIVTRAGSDGQWNLHGIGTDHFESVHAVYTTLTSPIIHWIEQQLIVA